MLLSFKVKLVFDNDTLEVIPNQFELLLSYSDLRIEVSNLGPIIASIQMGVDDVHVLVAADENLSVQEAFVCKRVACVTIRKLLEVFLYDWIPTKSQKTAICSI